jgi:DNA-binding GntR family transcriptional regulator
MSRRKNGAGHIYSELKHFLVNYRFRPGTQLHPSDLAKQFKVSSTPVREALHWLGGEHLLVSIPNRGFFSKILNVEEMTELSVLTHVLLQHSILSNTRKSLGDWLAETVDDRHFEQTIDDAPLQLSLAEQLFERIASLSANHSLVSTIKSLNDRTHYIRMLDLEESWRGRETARQNRDLIEKIRICDMSGAVGNLQRQLQANLARIPGLVKEGLARGYAASTSSSASVQATVLTPFYQMTDHPPDGKPAANGRGYS